MFDNETDPKGRVTRRLQFTPAPDFDRNADDFRRDKGTVEQDKRNKRRLKLQKKQQRKAS